MSERTKDLILLFDGVCNLCSGIVHFSIARDPHQKFKFASLQSPEGRELLEKFALPTDDFDTFVLIDGEKCYLKSTAALRSMKEFSGLWPLMYAFIIVPKPLRDLVYDLIAKNRYDWFGKKDQCYMPTDDMKSRFLGELQ